MGGGAGGAGGGQGSLVAMSSDSFIPGIPATFLKLSTHKLHQSSVLNLVVGHDGLENH